MIIRKIERKLTEPLPLGLKIATRNLLWEAHTLLAHKKSLFQARKYKNASNLKLHLGCGPNIKRGWINVDQRQGVDLQLDLREPLPFPNESCSMIYSEHFFEHIDYPEPVTSLLKECWRVLRPGGQFSIVVPDIELVLRCYFEGGDDAYYEAQQRWHPAWCQTQLEHLNYNFRQDGEHRFCYDFDALKRLLEQCRFRDIVRREFVPDLDSDERIVGSLYVDCVKLALLA